MYSRLNLTTLAGALGAAALIALPAVVMADVHKHEGGATENHKLRLNHGNKRTTDEAAAQAPSARKRV